MLAFILRRAALIVPTFIGVTLFAFDSAEELEKLAANAPGARVYCRIRYGDPDSDTFPQAVIYKIDFYDDATFKGAPKFTVE